MRLHFTVLFSTALLVAAVASGQERMVDSATLQSLISTPQDRYPGTVQSRARAIYIDDIQLGEVPIRFAGRAGKLRTDDLKALQSLISFRRGNTVGDTSRMRLILLLERGEDRLHRMDRMAAVAQGLASAGIACNTLEISCIEDSGMIASRPQMQGINTSRRKTIAGRTRLILTAVTSTDREIIDNDLAFLGRLCDFL